MPETMQAEMPTMADTEMPETMQAEMPPEDAEMVDRRLVALGMTMADMTLTLAEVRANSDYYRKDWVNKACDVGLGAGWCGGGGIAYARADGVHQNAANFLEAQQGRFHDKFGQHNFYRNADASTRAGYAFEHHHETSLGMNERLFGSGQQPTQSVPTPNGSDFTLQVEVPADAKAPNGMRLPKGATEVKHVDHQMKCGNNPSKALKNPKHDGMRRVVPADKVEKVQADFKRANHKDAGLVSDRVEGQVKGKGGKNLTSDPVELDDMKARTKTDDTGKDKVHDAEKDKLAKNKPLRGWAVVITTATATLLAAGKQFSELWPLYKKRQISFLALMGSVLSTAVVTAIMAGGIGGLLAVLEECAPKLAKAAGPVLMFGLVAVQAGRAIYARYQGQITSMEMCRRIGECLAQVGAGYGGALIGMAAGTPFGPIGILIGGCVGGFIGSEAGAFVFKWFWDGLRWLTSTRDIDYWIHALRYRHRRNGNIVGLLRALKHFLIDVWGDRLDWRAVEDKFDWANHQLDRHFRQFALHTHRDHLPPDHTEADALAADAALISAKDSILSLKEMLINNIPGDRLEQVREQQALINQQQADIVAKDEENARLRAQLAALQAKQSC